MKAILITTLFAALLALTPAAVSAEDGKPVIAVVDVKKILNDSEATKSIQKQINEKKQKVQDEIGKQEENLRKTDKELAQQRTVMDKEAFDKKVAAFKEEVVEAQRNVQTKRAQLENAYANALEEVEKVVVSIVSELAEKKGFYIAVPKSNAIYAKDTLDISDEVLSTLNKRLPKVNVKLEK